MSNIIPLTLLAYAVNIIKNSVSDIKIEFTSPTTANLKDGNDNISLEQKLDSNNHATVFISDPKDIIFSEDLYPVLNDLHKGVEGELKKELQEATIVINDIDVATHLILETAKDAFDQLSNSYEFVRTSAKEITNVKCAFKFGKTLFAIDLLNTPEQISVKPNFSSNIEAPIKKVIEADTSKVEHALNGIFKGKK